MSSIISREHAERITRQAAQAIGLHIPHNARWDIMLGGFQLAPATPYTANTFAPLNDPADAYKIESALKINVFHRALSNQSYVMSFRSSEHSDGAALMRTVNKGDDALRMRMETATMFAALTLLMEAEA